MCGINCRMKWLILNNYIKFSVCVTVMLNVHHCHGIRLTRELLWQSWDYHPRRSKMPNQIHTAPETNKSQIHNYECEKKTMEFWIVNYPCPPEVCQLKCILDMWSKTSKSWEILQIFRISDLHKLLNYSKMNSTGLTEYLKEDIMDEIKN